MADSRRRWLAGRCPCCGGELCEWEWNGTEYQPQAVAEGVTFCGRCIGNRHHQPDEFLAAMLRSLVP